MAESSFMWDSAGGGDASPHSETDVVAFFAALAGMASANQGVLPGALEQLMPEVVGTNIRINTGWAIADGHPYRNSSDLTVTPVVPSVGTTGRRVVLLVNWSAQTVRVVEISSADGTAAIPSMTQTSGTTYHIPLCSYTVTTGGVIGSFEDDREFLGSGGVAQAAYDYGDGDVTITGTTTLTAPKVYDRLVVASGGILEIAGYFVFANQIIVQAGGIIRNNGTNGSAGVGGGSSVTGGAGGTGGSSRLRTAAGATGGTGRSTSAGDAGTNGSGGTGGAGGAGASHAGGAAATVSTTGATYRSVPLAALDTNSTQGGASGGGGGGDGTNSGGSGGGGGGCVVLCANDIVVEATGIISANGGNGGAASAGNAGGGGGGGGGIIRIFAKRYTNLGTVSATGGTGGAKTGTGVAGSAGGDGYVIVEERA